MNYLSAKTTTTRKANQWIALSVLCLFFSACSADEPSSPSSGTGGGSEVTHPTTPDELQTAEPIPDESTPIEEPADTGDPQDTDDPAPGDGPLPPPKSLWELKIKVSVPDGFSDGGTASNRMVAGTDSTATDAFDNSWDIRALLAGPIRAYFFHEGESGYDTGNDQLWYDIRAVDLPQEWSIKIFAENGREVTLEWDLPRGDADCGTNQFILTDEDGLISDTDLCVNPPITYQGDGLIRSFVLRVS